MNCAQASEHMMKCFDGEFNDIENAQFRQHLKNCEKCAADYESMRNILSILESDGAAEPPEDFESRIMEKVNIIEERKKRNTSRWLTLLYNASTLVSIVLLLLYVANLKEINIISGLDGVGEYFTSLSGIVVGLFAIVTSIYGLVLNVLGVIVQVFVTLVKSYYHIIITMLALLLAIQKTFFVVVDRNGRETR